MLKQIPFIHLLEMNHDKYFYDTNTNAILNISTELYEFLKKMLSGDYPDSGDMSEETRDNLQFLLSQGFLQGRNDKVKIEHPETNRLEAIYKSNLNTMTLQVTQNCNLRCKYCIYSGSYVNRTHTNKRMSIKTALEAIDFLQKHSFESEEISIGFYGGEPLLEMELIQACVEYAEKIFAGKKLMFYMTSNATLLNKACAGFLAEHKFNLTVSLDGPSDIQNKNRIFAGSNKGTFDTVMRNLEMVKTYYPDFIKHITFNAVIDLKQDVSCTSRFFMSYDLVKEIGVSGNFVDTSNLKNQKEDDIPFEFYANSNYEVFKVYLSSCTDLLKNHRSSLYSFQLSYLNNSIAERSIISSHESCVDCPGGQCLPGIQRLFVNADGKFFPCERVDEAAEVLCLGDIWNGFDVEKGKRILNVSQITEKECRECWCYKLCEQCCGKAVQDGKFDRNRRLSFCHATRQMAEESIKNYIVLKKYKSRLIK